MELTLSGAIPGLLRRGSPVRRGPWAAVVTSPPAVAPDWWTVAAGETNDPGGPSWCEDRASAFALDLTDATGRAHAAWWLQAHTQPDTGGLWLDGVTPPEDFRRAWWAVAGRLPIFADLDPDDPRLLPDRSRWVDAEALRRVVLHVAGVTP